VRGFLFVGTVLLWSLHAPCNVPAAPVTDSSASTASFLYQLAQEHWQAGRIDEAIHELRKLLLLEPQHAQARRELASLESLKRARREQAMQESLAGAERAMSVRDAAMLEALTQAGQPSPTGAIPPTAERRRPSQRPPESEGVVPPRRGVVGTINETMAPLAISGEVRSTAGMTRDDFILQDANGDLNERNFRILSGPFRYNTFDPRIFSRFRLNLDTTEQQGWQLHSNMTVDPWSFIGTTKKVTVIGQTPTDQVDLQLKWWSGNNTAINETFLTAHNGDSLATPEIELDNGHTVATRVTSTFSNVFQIPELEVDYTFQPIRWFWTGYRSDQVEFRVFPLALEDQAVSSDDPLGLSNHHIYWEPSPWLDEWKPGRRNTGASPVDFTRGTWSDDLSFFTRDSDLTRLTALRGSSLQWHPSESTTLQTAVASPKGLWQEYDTINSLVGMARLKQSLFDDRLTLGGLYTTRWGFRERKRDAVNHVYSVDAALTPVEGTTVSGQGATSRSVQDRANAVENDFAGWAWHGAVTTQWWGEQLISRVFYTHMDDSFDPGLASYRQTRRDQFWGSHLHLKRRFRLLGDLTPASPLRWEDIDAVRIGDGVDVGRDAIGLRLSGAWWDHRLEPLVDLRNVHTTEGKYVETVVRNENTLHPAAWLTAKTLFLYHDLPQTIAGLDPFIVDDDTNTPFLSTGTAGIVNDRNPSLWTYSLGAEVSPSEAFALWAAWEHTNDSTLGTGNFPRGLLNSSSFTTTIEEGTRIRSTAPFLYGQGFFPQPPYPFYDIFRAGIYASPVDTLELSLDWTRNAFKQAGQIDDNLNHVGFMAAWSPIKRMTLVGRYVASWAVDITRLNAGETTRLASHHNLYGQLHWRMNDAAELTVEYGVSALGSPLNVILYDPQGDFYPTLDTEHLVRVLYTGSF